MVIVIFSVVTVYLLIGGMISTVAIAQGRAEYESIGSKALLIVLLTFLWLPFAIYGFFDTIRKL